MDTFILDRDTIWSRADLCLRASAAPATRVVVPDIVVQWFNIPYADILRQILLCAANAGCIDILKIDFEPDVKKERAANLSRLQYAVLHTALHLQSQGDHITVVTTSKPLMQACQS